MALKNFSNEFGPGYNVISIKNAKLEGFKYYFSGKKCAKGHISLRLIAGRGCSSCTLSASVAWKKDPSNRYRERKISYDAKYKSENREAVLSKKREHYHKNLDYYASYRENNKDRRAANNASWVKRHPEVNRMNVSKRRARVKVEADDFDIFVELEAIAACIRREKMTGYKWHVDHMVPVSKGGVHKYYNLQVIPAWMNQRKWCKMILTNPFEWVEYLPGAEKCGQRLY